jgi:hypothetical protein
MSEVDRLSLFFICVVWLEVEGGRGCHGIGRWGCGIGFFICLCSGLLLN